MIIVDESTAGQDLFHYREIMEFLKQLNEFGGYVVTPRLVEFWQGRPSHLHDRIQYRLDNGHWIRERLSP